MSLKKEGKSSKLGLHQEAQFTTNLMLKNKIEKKYQFKKFIRIRKNSNQKDKDHI
jgi:hypothetical protein